MTKYWYHLYNYNSSLGLVDSLTWNLVRLSDSTTWLVKYTNSCPQIERNSVVKESNETVQSTQPDGM